MRFGTVALDQAAGALLAHGLQAPGIGFRKGRVLSAEDIAALRAAGFAEVVVARLEAHDVGEDDAAARLALALADASLSVAAPFTGRVNLYAAERGLVILDPGRIDQVNLIDESITLATLPAWTPVEPGQMVATIKIIPFAVPEPVLLQTTSVAAGATPAIRVAPYRSGRVWLIQTLLPGLKPAVLEKTAAVTRTRLVALGLTLEAERHCAHDPLALAGMLAEAATAAPRLILIVGASAITDRRDILPDGLERAGGTVEHFGMPVDPGNLLLLGRLGPVPVLGVPGCARSPKTNGFDWVLQRLAAGLTVTGRDLMGMGVGGLLAEIPTRPRPRDVKAAGFDSEAPRAPRIAVLILAAGRSQRMGAANKLLVPLEGTPMVARVADAVLASSARPVLVVTGHQAADVRAALAGRALTFIDSPDFRDGLSASLRAGIAALPDDIDGVLVCLGDMPKVPAPVLDRLIAAYQPAEGRLICVPTVDGKLGNPVLWDRRFFAEIRALTGDAGARRLIAVHPEGVCEVPVTSRGVLFDIDTPETLAAASGET